MLVLGHLLGGEKGLDGNFFPSPACKPHFSISEKIQWSDDSKMRRKMIS